jgi:hypothetical protein
MERKSDFKIQKVIKKMKIALQTLPDSTPPVSSPSP